MDFSYLVDNIIKRYMPELDEDGCSDARDIVFDGINNDLQYAYCCGLSRNTEIEKSVQLELEERAAVEKLAKENHMRLKEYESGWGY